MIQLREKAEKDVQQHNIEMKEYVRTIDHDNRLRDFMSTKCRERHEDPQLVEWRRRKGEELFPQFEELQDQSLPVRIFFSHVRTRAQTFEEYTRGMRKKNTISKGTGSFQRKLKHRGNKPVRRTL